MNIEDYLELPYKRGWFKRLMDPTSSASRSFLDACPAATRRKRPLR